VHIVVTGQEAVADASSTSTPRDSGISTSIPEGLGSGAGMVGSPCVGGAGDGVLLEGATEVAEDPILTVLP